MGDYFHNAKDYKKTKLDMLWEHILVISKGNCDITDEMIVQETDDQYRMILGGLKLLHEDLALYKEDLAQKLEADHQLEILKKKNEELAQFNYVASHDLQEPLRTISSFSELLTRKYAEVLGEGGQSYLNLINSSAKRMSNLINDLLSYSRIGREPKKESVDCNTLLKEVMDDLKGVIEEAKPVFHIMNLPTINANRVGLYQLFLNLIGNAIKFRKENEQLEIAVMAKRIDSQYEFCIGDNGIGIEENYLDRIFGIFQKLHNKDEFEGTGIGLASCKKIVEMHSGKIWVESTSVSYTHLTLPTKA